MRTAAVATGVVLLISGCAVSDDGADRAAAACAELSEGGDTPTIENVQLQREAFARAADHAAAAAAEDEQWRPMALAYSKTLDHYDFVLLTLTAHGTDMERWSPEVQAEHQERGKAHMAVLETIRAECRIANSD